MGLDPLRKQIDIIDRSVLKQLNQRAELAAKIGEYKHQAGLPIYVPDREEKLLQKLANINTGPLNEKAIRAIYREIISASIANESPLKIVYLGPEATYTHQAAVQHFGDSLHYQAEHTIADVFSSVSCGRAEYGVIPIENSTEGVVGHSFDLLAETSLSIIAQTYLPIEHCLISTSSLDSIKEVYSRDNALGQCRQWLNQTLPKAKWIATESTAEAVLNAKNADGRAAIAGKLAARLYDVSVVAKNIQDKADNVTRFLIISKEVCDPIDDRKEDDYKSSYLFSLHDKPGILQNALQPFSKQGVNLSKIESRPSRKKSWDYYFFIDIIGHHQDVKVQSAIGELQSLCVWLKWLGSYPNTKA